MVRLKGTQSIETSINVSETQILEEAETIIRKYGNIKPHDFLKGVNIMYDDPYHRHGSISEYTRRLAEPQDLETFRVLGYLKDLQKLIEDRS